MTSSPTTACVTGPEVVLDLRGLRCPFPVLRAKKALRDLPVGAVLVLECTDPLTVIDVPHFVTQTGHVLQSHEQTGSVWVFRILKSK
jgi:tRNA 2-thiouridine synthesizing protein A